MVAPALLTSSFPFIFATGALGALLILWCVRFPLVAVSLLISSLALGQMVRLPVLGQSGGLLVSDGATLLVVLVVLAQSGRARRGFREGAFLLLLLMLPFVAWSLWGLSLNRLDVPLPNWLVGFAYWLRLSCYLLLGPALIVVLRGRARRGLALFCGIIVLLAVVGLLQVWFWPDLSVLGQGWDPHQGRLVSTWLDPNFFGGLLAITFPWLIGIASYTQFFKRHPLMCCGIGAVILTALILTKSRSSIVALLLSGVLLSPFYSLWWSGRAQPHDRIKILAIGGLIILVGIISFMALGERAWGIFIIDPTAEVRFKAMREVIQLAATYPLVGVGYNLYQFAARDAGLASDFSLHSRAGSDNSLLTLGVTTGLSGILLFLLPYFAVGHLLLAKGVGVRPVAVGTITALLVWLIHSQFVNSLLYAHLLAAVASMVALSWVLVMDGEQV